MPPVTYTQHTIAFPLVELARDWHVDEVSLSGRGGEMKFVFMDFNRGRAPDPNLAVQVCCFTESVNLLTSPEVQQILRWIKGMTPERRNNLTPEKLIRKLESLEVGKVVPSFYHLAGIAS